MICGLILHIFLGSLTFWNNDDYSNYHNYEGYQGALFILARLLVLGFSIYGIEWNKNEWTRKMNFFNWFRWIAVLYLWAFPIMVIMGFAFVPHMRYKVVKIGNFILQIGALYFLTKMLTTKSFYYRHSKSSKSILTVSPNTYKDQ